MVILLQRLGKLAYLARRMQALEQERAALCEARTALDIALGADVKPVIADSAPSSLGAGVLTPLFE